MLSLDGDVIPVSAKHFRDLMPLVLSGTEHARQPEHVGVVCSKHRVSLAWKGLRYGAQLEEGENVFQARGLFMTWANQNVNRVSRFEHNTVVEIGTHA